MTVPEGFQKIPTDSPFVQMVGPLYYKEEGSTVTVGVLVEEKHCNSTGNLHGGMIATIMDLTLGNRVGDAAVPQAVKDKYEQDGLPPDPEQMPKLVTANLSVSYLGRAAVGDWIEIQAKVDKSGKGLSFASGDIFRDGEMITSATGIYRNLRG